MDTNISTLKEECSYLAATNDRRALKTLSKLLKIAEDAGDFGLSGFVYFHRANYHYIGAEYDAFHKDLGLAFRALLRSDEHELLARSVNFFANEAYSKGALDISYNYYMSALQFLEDQPDSSIKGGLLVNLAGLLSCMESYAEARNYFKKGISLLKKNRNDFYYERNMIAAYVIDGQNSIAMGELDAAKKTYAAAKRIYDAADEGKVQEIRLAYTIFETRLALAMREDQKAKALIETLTLLLAREGSIYDSMADIREFCRTLIDAGLLKEAGQIIDATSVSVMAGDVTHAMYQLTEMKVDYYEKTRDETMLMQALTEQNHLFLRSEKEQQELYRNSIEYIQLIGELREEEERIRRENEVLFERVSTDPLCGIPNRYAMDKEMERAFERAYAARTSLGIGIVDVNRFKEVNDTFGHQAGDKYLAMIGRVLKTFAKKEQVFCARYGGDEFLIIYEDMRDNEILRIAEQLSRTIAKRKVTLNGKRIGNGVTISQGICNDTPRRKSRIWDYLKEADAALYRNKGRAKADAGATLYRLPGKYR